MLNLFFALDCSFLSCYLFASSCLTYFMLNDMLFFIVVFNNLFISFVFSAVVSFLCHSVCSSFPCFFSLDLQRLIISDCCIHYPMLLYPQCFPFSMFATLSCLSSSYVVCCSKLISCFLHDLSVHFYV